MDINRNDLSKTFVNFFESEKSSGILLVMCTVLSLLLANSYFSETYLSIWQTYVGGMSIEHWINDALMAIFFLLIGLELERELYNGELSDFKNALLPIFAAFGGIGFPALIHFFLNSGKPTQVGIGIPMATDIAFALGVLALLGNRVPTSLKVFLTALAVMDDLGAIIIIAVFYTEKLSIIYLIGSIAVFALLVTMNRLFRVMSLLPYMAGGILMWILMLKSGVHATIAGVLLAFTIPFSAKQDDQKSPSHLLENFLHKPVAFIIMPIFALSNTGIIVGSNWAQGLTTANSLGIISGLVFGKPLGIILMSFIAVALGLSRLPPGMEWRHVLGAGLLGGIGFTMSIFIANLAFATNPEIINTSKLAILLASLTAGIIGYLWLRYFTKPIK